MKKTVTRETGQQPDDQLVKIEKAFWDAAEKYPGAAFSRKEFAGFSDYSVGYLANLDSKGEGPDGGFYSGRKKRYLKKPSIDWLMKRLTIQHLAMTANRKAVSLASNQRETASKSQDNNNSSPIKHQHLTLVIILLVNMPTWSNLGPLADLLGLVMLG